MKLLKTLILILTFSPNLLARRGAPPTEADYIVPTSPEFIAFSRFKVKIIDPYQGPETKQISYGFPEFLTGEIDKVFTMKRVPETVNSWSGPEIDAHCTVHDDDFSCNIYVKKNKNNTLITADRALDNLIRLNLSDAQIRGMTGVINAFYSHEPAGFLSYGID